MNKQCARFILLGSALSLFLTACGRPDATPADQPPSDHSKSASAGVRIFPSVDTLPANHLKFYIEFPEAMARGRIFEHFSLIENESGQAVPDPFREVELWDESGKRLTLWFHPGRQKPGVNLNVEIGPILDPGKSYTLIVSGDWEKESGQPLGTDAHKQFQAGPMDNSQPNPEKWQYSIPAAGTKNPLVITFSKALDYALIPRTIQIHAEANPNISHHHNDRSIHFTPSEVWKKGPVKITTAPKLEDLAGNSIARPFNLDLQSTITAPDSSQTTRTFEIK